MASRFQLGLMIMERSDGKSALNENFTLRSLRLFEPAFVGAEATFTTIAVWVQLVGLPISFYYMTTLNRLGKEWNLRVDKEREERARSTLWIA
ncbi:unnamed protein product [Dovyalis caffra]|uniref:Uncharacterized protein n=1 Tax=Dovyalis caffra TaxID=77055 RepID=A0AAV1R5S3_9ROSI|nr:unnamed protein product [Dovyalis caffra]